MTEFLKATPLAFDEKNIFIATSDITEDEKLSEETASTLHQNHEEHQEQSCVDLDANKNYCSFDRRGYLTFPESPDQGTRDYSYAYSSGNRQTESLSRGKCNTKQNTNVHGTLDNNECAAWREIGTEVSNIHYDDRSGGANVESNAPSVLKEYDNVRQSELEGDDGYLKPDNSLQKTTNQSEEETDYHLVDYSKFGSAGNTTLHSEGYNNARIPVKRPRQMCNRCRLIATASIAGAVIVTGVVVAIICILKGSHSCEEYPSPDFGTVNQEDKVVYLACDEGYKLTGNSVIHCLADGTWDSHSTCNVEDCGEYSPPPHASVGTKTSVTTLNTTLQLVCDDGYKFENSTADHVVCDGNGNWTGNPICKNKVSIHVAAGMVYIGKSVDISCVASDVSGWTSIFIYTGNATSLHSASTLVSIQKTVSHYRITVNGDHISSIRENVTSSYADFTIRLNPVQCSDVNERIGNVTVLCMIYNGTYVQHGQQTIQVLRLPSQPVLTPTQYVVENQDTQMFVCDVNFTEPNGLVEIQTDVDSPGTFQTILYSAKGEYMEDKAWIEDLKQRQENCSYRTIIQFAIKQVSIKWHRQHLRCVAKPAATALNTTTVISEMLTLKVVPADICEANNVQNGYTIFPYDCRLLIECEAKKVINVFKCPDNQCFRPSLGACGVCLSGGCPLTDIYFNSTTSSFVVGASSTLNCTVEDAVGLTDVIITRNYGEIVASYQNGANLIGFQVVTGESFINGTVGRGTLVVKILSMKCSDEATYKCQLKGVTANLEDEVDLDIGC